MGPHEGTGCPALPSHLPWAGARPPAASPGHRRGGDEQRGRPPGPEFLRPCSRLRWRLPGVPAHPPRTTTTWRPREEQELRRLRAYQAPGTTLEAVTMSPPSTGGRAASPSLPVPKLRQRACQWVLGGQGGVVGEGVGRKDGGRREGAGEGEEGLVPFALPGPPAAADSAPQEAKHALDRRRIPAQVHWDGRSGMAC